jgi:hypothetical protein
MSQLQVGCAQRSEDDNKVKVSKHDDITECRCFLIRSTAVLHMTCTYAVHLCSQALR